MSNEFRIEIIKREKSVDVRYPEQFLKNLPEDLHPEDIVLAIKATIATEPTDKIVTLSREDIHAKVKMTYGTDRSAMWGDHSHGINSVGGHSHN
jgi:hypothetical protein